MGQQPPARETWAVLGKMCTRDVKTRTGGGDRQSFPRGAAIASQIKIFGFEPKRVVIGSPPPVFFFPPPQPFGVQHGPSRRRTDCVWGKRNKSLTAIPLQKGARKGEEMLKSRVGCAKWGVHHPPTPSNTLYPGRQKLSGRRRSSSSRRWLVGMGEGYGLCRKHPARPLGRVPSGCSWGERPAASQLSDELKTRGARTPIPVHHQRPQEHGAGQQAAQHQ